MACVGQLVQGASCAKSRAGRMHPSWQMLLAASTVAILSVHGDLLLADAVVTALQGASCAKSRAGRAHPAWQMLPAVHQQALPAGDAQCGRARDPAHILAHHRAVFEELAPACRRPGI